MSSKLLLPIGAVLVLVAIVWAIFHRGETVGAAKVEQKVERQHKKQIVEARTDERAATAAAAAIGSRDVARADAAIAALKATEQEMRLALDSIPQPLAGDPALAGAAGADLPAAPAGVLASSINALVARANRAADDADAAGRADPGGAP